jgi:hypothetical protein
MISIARLAKRLTTKINHKLSIDFTRLSQVEHVPSGITIKII